MDEKKSQERNAFLAGVEENFQRGDFETILMTAGLRLKRMPGDLDARLAICRARIEQGALGEVGDLLSEIERVLAGLDRVCALLRELGRQTGLTDETRALFEKFGLAAPAGRFFPGRFPPVADGPAGYRARQGSPSENPRAPPRPHHL